MTTATTASARPGTGTDGQVLLAGEASLIPTWIRRAAEQHAARVATTDGTRELTFREVDARSSSIANALLELPGEPLGRVALALPNIIEFLESDLGVAKARKTKVAVNTRLSFDEIVYVLRDSGAETVFVYAPGDELIDGLNSADCPDLRTIVRLDADGPLPDGGARRWIDYGDLLRASSQRPNVQGRADDPSYILYTSGTTGRPKGAVSTDASRRAATVNMLLDELDVRPGDGMIHVAPLAHGSGSKLLAHFLRGSRAIVGQRWAPAGFLRLAQQLNATASFVVPTMLADVRDVLDKREAEFPESLRRITYGGAVTLPDVMAQLVERVGPRFVQVYGSCEAPHPVLVLAPADHEAGLADREVMRAAGRPVTNVDIRIVREDQSSCAPGEAGELLVSGPNLMAGYWEQPEATAEVLDKGWYRTGDVAVAREDGLVTIVDRTRDVIITGGLNVYPAEVERVLGEIAAVGEASVFSVPNERWGEQVTAAVTVRGKATTQDLIDHCRRRLAGYKIPKKIVILDELPRGSTGKVSKRDLQQQMRGGADG